MPQGDGMRDPSTRASIVINLLATSQRKPISAPIALPLESKAIRQLEMRLQSRERKDAEHAPAKQTPPPDASAHCKVTQERK